MSSHEPCFASAQLKTQHQKLSIDYHSHHFCKFFLQGPMYGNYKQRVKTIAVVVEGSWPSTEGDALFCRASGAPTQPYGNQTSNVFGAWLLGLGSGKQYWSLLQASTFQVRKMMAFPKSLPLFRKKMAFPKSWLLSQNKRAKSLLSWALLRGPGTKSFGPRLSWGPRRPHKHKDPTTHSFWYLPYSGPWNQDVRSLCLHGLLGSYHLEGAPRCPASPRGRRWAPTARGPASGAPALESARAAGPGNHSIPRIVYSIQYIVYTTRKHGINESYINQNRKAWVYGIIYLEIRVPTTGSLSVILIQLEGP